MGIKLQSKKDDEIPWKRKATRRKSGCSVANIENFTSQEFTKHKREYERHAAAWRVARSRNDEKLLRKSAQQMLRHLREMYRLAIAPPKWSRSDQRLSAGTEADLWVD